MFGNLLGLRKDPLAYLTRCAREYGDLVHLRVLSKDVYLVSDPKLIETILLTQRENFVKAPGVQANRRLLGDGLVTSDGALWRRQRTILQPAFQRAHVVPNGSVVVELTEQMLSAWEHRATVDINAEMMHLVMRIIARFLFHVELRPEEAQRVEAGLTAAMRYFYERTVSIFPVPEFVPTPSNIAFRRALDDLDRLIYDMIDRRQGQAEGPQDMISLLVQARDENGNPLPVRLIRDEIVTSFMAGHETTALALVWTWYLLDQHPDVRVRLEEELSNTLGGRLPGMDDVPALKYTRMVFMEAMRLYPPVWCLARKAVNDCELGGYPIRAGTSLLISPWVVHHNGRFFEEPERFVPERWADGLVKKLPSFAYFPFGGGPRICIGNRVAELTGLMVLATVAQRFRMRVEPGQAERPKVSLTVRPRNGMVARLERRGKGEKS